MHQIRISAISYLNSLPFVYCLEHTDIRHEIDVSYDIPSQCADKLLADEADIGLIPIVETLRMKEHYIISDLCIGAVGAVKSVVLASSVPLQEVKTIYLDHHSRTSVALAKILAANYWHIAPEWVNVPKDILARPVSKGSAAVVIGDKTFGLKAPYLYDLSEEWTKFTQLPFVFACWVANKKLDGHFIRRFDEAMKFILSDMDTIAAYYQDRNTPDINVLDYWTHSISYLLDDAKRKGLALFLQYAQAMIDDGLISKRYD